LFGEVGRASLAQIRFSVPANLMANPGAAAGTLPEIRPDFFHCFRKRGIMEFPTHRTLHFVSRIARSAESAQETAGGAEDRFRHSKRRSLKLRHVAVATLIAMEFELEPAVGGEVVVVAYELDQSHKVKFNSTKIKTK
jgi:hypothetical protein